MLLSFLNITIDVESVARETRDMAEHMLNAQASSSRDTSSKGQYYQDEAKLVG